MNGHPSPPSADAVTVRAELPGTVPASETTSLESELASVFGTGCAVAVNSGTAAIHCALLASGVRPGDEVLVPAVSVVMSIAPVLYCGARPVFVDCEHDGYGMDLDDLVAKITPRTKAVETVYLWGRSGNPSALADVTTAHGLRLIEDACQAHGTRFGGRMLGSFGHAAALSFHQTKIVQCGEGGAVLTNDDLVAQQCRALRTHWQAPPRGELPMSGLGYNYRLAGPLVTVARESLAEFSQLLNRRKEQTNVLQGLAGNAPGITAVTPDPEEDWNGYSALFRLDLPRPRAFSEHLAACGVPNSVGTFGLIACDQRPVFAPASSSSCPNAARLIDTTLAVSLTADDSDTQIARYADIIISEARRWAPN